MGKKSTKWARHGGVISLGENLHIYDIDCHTSQYCFMCEFEDITKFTIRGLCSNLDNILDIQYLVDMDKVSQSIDKGIIWTGYRQSRILFNKTLQRWTITSLSDARPILTLVNKVTGKIKNIKLSFLVIRKSSQ